MKKIFALLIICFGFTASVFSQTYTKPNNSYGERLNRLRPDSTLLLPTGNGVPSGISGTNSLRSTNQGMAGIFFDSTGGNGYLYNPKVGIWTVIGTSFYSIDSPAIRRKGTSLQNIVSFNSFSNGTAGTVGGDSSTIAIGDRALTALTSGQGNIGIGSQAAQANTTGQWNIAIGKKAFETSQTGNNNIAIGNEASLSINGVSDQIAIGRNALRSNSAGTGNIAIGATALNVATGSNNTALGNAALSGISTGARNTGVGGSAGVEITTGSDNTEIGYFAGRQGAAGKGSTVALGSEAARFDAGSFTTMIGMQAGLGASAGSITHTGDYNIGIGYQAMRNTTTIRSGSSNIAIGDRIDLPSVTSSNQVTIGSNGVNWLTRFTGEGWLVNHSGSAVTTQTASAAFEVKSTTGGILFPTMTSTERDAISSPVNGLVLYNTTTDKLQVRAAGAWVDLH